MGVGRGRVAVAMTGIALEFPPCPERPGEGLLERLGDLGEEVGLLLFRFFLVLGT